MFRIARTLLPKRRLARWLVLAGKSRGKPAVNLCFATAWLISCAVVGLADQAGAETPTSKKPVFILSTATTGGAFHQGGVSLSALVKIKLLPDHQIDLTTKNSSGSMENIARLAEGTSDFAIVQALLGHHARRGTGPAEQMGRQRNLRAVSMLWPNVEHFIIRKSAVSEGSISDLSSLKGQRMSFGQEASAIESNRFLLANLGLDINRDLERVLLGFRSSAAAFRRGDIDGLSLPASTPMPAFVDLIGQLGADATILSWTEEELSKADGGLGLWSPLTIPAQTYPGQIEPIVTIAQPNFLAVRADLDEDVVYAVTKAIFENLTFLQRLHDPFEFLTLDRAVDGLPVPLHPGALRYFQEIRLDMRNSVLAETDYDIFGQDTRNSDEIRQKVRRGVVSLITPEDGTSDQLLNDLVDVLGEDDDLRVLPIKGKGTAHNLADLLYLSGVDIGVLQTDAMEFARRQGLYPDLTGNIRYISKWHDLEVHLLVRDDVLRPDHLTNKSVNFGPPGSGSEITASRLFNKLRVPIKQTSFSHGIALKKLKAGEIAGMVYVAGKPVPLFEKIQVRDGLRLLSLPKFEDGDLYRTAAITEADYPTLVFGDRTIQTMAVPSVLATYDWPTSNQRYQPIAAFIETLFARLDQLQTSDRHPKWQEIDPNVDLSPWRRHQAAEEFLRQSTTAGETIGQGGPLTLSAGKVDDALPDNHQSNRSPAANVNHDHRRPVF